MKDKAIQVWLSKEEIKFLLGTIDDAYLDTTHRKLIGILLNERLLKALDKQKDNI